MRGHHAGPEPAARGRQRRGDHRVGEHAGVEQLPPKEQRLPEIPDEDGDDGRLSRPDVEPHRAEPLVDAAGVDPEPLPALRLALHDAQCCEHPRRVRRWERRREDEGPGVVPEVIDHLLGAHDEAADRRQRLRERADDQVHLVGDAEVGGGAVAFRAQHAHGVGVVDREDRAVPLSDFEQRRDVGDVAFHRVDAVHHDHLAHGGGHLLHLPLELGQIAVREALGVPEAHLGAVHDGGVVQLVEEHHVAAPHQAGNQSQVRLVAGGEDDASLLAEELGELPLELPVQVQRPVEQTAPGAPRAVTVERGPRGREDFRMMREPQVVVGAHHDPVLAFDDDDGVFGAGDRLVPSVQPGGLDLARLGRESPALLEQRDVLQGLGAHGAPRSCDGTKTG